MAEEGHNVLRLSELAQTDPDHFSTRCLLDCHTPPQIYHCQVDATIAKHAPQSRHVPMRRVRTH